MAQREEWAVRHAQGVHPGPFTEAQAREFAANNVKQDERRRPEARDKTKLLRRYVTELEEVD